VRIYKQAPSLKIPPLHILRFYIIAGSLTQSVVMNLLPCFGEEFGWRGYLLMRLKPLGVWPAMIGSGAIWGVWHAPIILQGHNYPEHPLLGVPLMVGFCILLSIIFSWLRLASGSVFTAAVAHASINGPGFMGLMFMRDRNDVTAGLTGFIGLAVMLIFVLALWRFGAFRHAERACVEP
jgi:membrane protease YdiL (CAAX protease family)